MKTLIIEDETPAANRIKKMLTAIDPSIEVLEVCNSIEKSVAWLKKNPAPDLILMDIELTDGKSFDIFNHTQITSPIIFTTAYDEFAIKAIKFSALDYLLKPIDEAELTEAIGKAKKTNAAKSPVQPDFLMLQQFLAGFSSGKKPQRLAVSNLNGTTFVSIEKIIRLEADSNYTQIILSDNKKITASRTLKEYDDFLSDLGFFRTHNAHLINLSYVDKYLKGEGGHVVMSNGDTIEVSRQKKKDLLTLLS